MYQSTYYSQAGTARNIGTYEYLMSYARRMFQDDSGMIEIRDAHGTLKASVWTENDEVKEWENK